MRRLKLMLGPRWRIPMAILNVLPVAGVGAIIVGRRNAHTRLFWHGIVQAVLVLFGSWPLIVPGAVGFGWAIYDSVRIWQARLVPIPPRNAPAPPR